MLESTNIPISLYFWVYPDSQISKPGRLSGPRFPLQFLVLFPYMQGIGLRDFHYNRLYTIGPMINIL